MTRKRDVSRPYPPEMVSAETLAYLLDMSPSTIDDYERQGLLPAPVYIGNAKRWDRQAVLESIRNIDNAGDSGQPPITDDYMGGLDGKADGRSTGRRVQGNGARA